MTNKRRKKVGELLVSQGLISPEQLIKSLEEHHKTGTSLGLVLVRFKYISEDTLYDVLSRQIEEEQRKKVGEIFVSFGFITPDQLSQALVEQKKHNIQFGQALVKLGFIGEEKIFDVLSAQLDLPHIVLEGYPFSKEAIRKIPADLARSYKAISLFTENNVLAVAMTDPTNLRIVDHLKHKTGMDIEPFLSTEQGIMRAIELEYASLDQKPVQEKKPVPKNLPTKQDSPIAGREPRMSSEEKNALRSSVNLLLGGAVKEKATDIHIEEENGQYRVRYRKQGILNNRPDISARINEALLCRIKSIAGIKTGQSIKPCVGRVSIRVEGDEIDLRVSTFPSIDETGHIHENLVLHINYHGAEKMEIDTIGLLGNTQERFCSLLELPEGLILVSGPEMSGKTTTLYAALRRLVSPTKSVMAIEKRIDMKLEGVSQTQIDSKKGMASDRLLRSALDVDPDVVMLGEMENAKTYKMVMQAVKERCLVLSSIVAENATDAIHKLYSLNINPSIIFSTISGVLSQRLLRRVCGDCKESYAPSKEFVKFIGLDNANSFCRGKGCSACSQTGYRGKIGVFELLVPNDQIRSMILLKKPAQEIRDCCKKNGMTTLREDALQKVKEGLTTVEEALACTAQE